MAHINTLLEIESNYLVSSAYKVAFRELYYQLSSIKSQQIGDRMDIGVNVGLLRSVCTDNQFNEMNTNIIRLVVAMHVLRTKVNAYFRNNRVNKDLHRTMPLFNPYESEQTFATFKSKMLPNLGSIIGIMRIAKQEVADQTTPEFNEVLALAETVSALLIQIGG